MCSDLEHTDEPHVIDCHPGKEVVFVGTEMGIP